MRKCQTCNSELNIVKSGQKSEPDTTKITTVLLFACVNRECKQFVGDSMDNPVNIQDRVESVQESDQI
jgi:hypothetical protein